MTLLNQTGMGDKQASFGDNSPIIKSNTNKITITMRQKAGWFFGGLVVPIVVALITEWIEQGKVSEVLSLFVRMFR